MQLGEAAADAAFATGIELSDRRLYRQRATVKCRLAAKTILDKVALHEALAGTGLVAETRVVDDTTAMPEGAVWILRGNWGFGGSASLVVTTDDELAAARTRLCSHWESNAHWIKPAIIASDYIVDPALFKGAKFHIRAYVTARVWKEGGRTRRSAQMMKTGLIIPANAPYVRGDWGSAAVHDSHGAGNASSGIFPDDCGLIDGVATGAAPRWYSDAVVALLKSALESTLDTAGLYPESPSAFELWGADIMFDRAGRAYLIEINDYPGLTWLKLLPAGRTYETRIAQYIIDTGLHPFFPELPYDGHDVVELIAAH